jgi:hypothetical protein
MKGDGHLEGEREALRSVSRTVIIDLACAKREAIRFVSASIFS